MVGLNEVTTNQKRRIFQTHITSILLVYQPITMDRFYILEREHDRELFEYDTDLLGTQSFNLHHWIGDTEPDTSWDEFETEEEIEEWYEENDEDSGVPHHYMPSDALEDLELQWDTIIKEVKDRWEDPSPYLKYLEALRDFLKNDGDDVIWAM